MKLIKLTYPVIAIFLAAVTYQSFAQTENKDSDTIQQYERDRQADREIDNDRFDDTVGGTIYGGKFMTNRERNRYIERIKAAKSEKERNEIRSQHQKEMRFRENMNNNRGNMNNNQGNMNSNRSSNKGR